MNETFMSCEACPIMIPAANFADLVANGWNMQHTFQIDDLNHGQVIVCTGKFHLEGTVPPEPVSYRETAPNIASNDSPTVRSEWEDIRDLASRVHARAVARLQAKSEMS